MDFISEFFEVKNILHLIEAIEALVASLIKLFGTTFSWLGAGILTAIAIGATCAIILRILGR